METESTRNVQTGLVQSASDAFLIYESGQCEESFEVDSVLHKESINVYCDICETIHVFKLAKDDTD